MNTQNKLKHVTIGFELRIIGLALIIFSPALVLIGENFSALIEILFGLIILMFGILQKHICGNSQKLVSNKTIILLCCMIVLAFLVIWMRLLDGNLDQQNTFSKSNILSRDQASLLYFPELIIYNI